MASFLGLPNEINITIDVTAPDDIENFALCCKLVHDLAGKILKQHRANKCTYSSFCSNVTELHFRGSRLV